MWDLPDYYWEWTEDEKNNNTYVRIIKPDVPPDILKKLVDFERTRFGVSARITLLNVDLETGQLISVEEGVKRFNEHKERLRRHWQEELLPKKQK